MAFGWIAAFKAVPWPQVIQAAPAIVQGARRLWSSAHPQEAAGAGSARRSQDQRLEHLEVRLAELERRQAASSELIKSLAEQNASLIEAMAILRLRTRVLMVVSALLAAALVAGLIFL